MSDVFIIPFTLLLSQTLVLHQVSRTSHSWTCKYIIKYVGKSNFQRIINYCKKLSECISYCSADMFLIKSTDIYIMGEKYKMMRHCL